MVASPYIEVQSYTKLIRLFRFWIIFIVVWVTPIKRNGFKISCNIGRFNEI